MAQVRQYHQHDDDLSINNSSIPQRTPVSPLLPSQQFPLQLRTAGHHHDGHEMNTDEPLVSPIMSSSPSVATTSDTTRLSALSGLPSQLATTLTLNPANVQPPAAYVAPFGAAQVVTEHQSIIGESDDDHRLLNKDDVSFTPASLALINAFLDQLLFSFLSTARATTLNALRTAVTDILRHKLARDAIASANEELADLLAGGDDEEDEPEASYDDPKWDLDLIWRRTRLRVMVYMRLGEMEDDDEERYVKEQEALGGGERGRFSSSAGLVSWSAAIFLTSVLEHVAEQTLQVAGQAAVSRYRRRDYVADEASVLVDDQDAERIALNPALGRLWRSWRKTVRSVRPATPNAREEAAMIGPSPAKSVSTLRDSFGTAPESAQGESTNPWDEEEDIGTPLGEDPTIPEYIIASAVRLPLGDPLRDIDEIEVPGLARDPSDAGSECPTPIASKADRRRSFSNYESRAAEIKALSEADLGTTGDHVEPKLQRRRSTSVPAPYRNILAAMLGDEEEEQIVTPTEEKEVVPEAETKDEKEATTEAPVEVPRQATIGDLLMDDAPKDTKMSKRDIEELDKRKSLIDIKTLLASVNGTHAGFVTKKDVVDHERPKSAGSDKSFSLGNKEASPTVQQPVAVQQHLEDANEELAQIGVATTSDRAIVPARTPSAAGTKSPSPGPNDISRASSIVRSKYSPNLSEDARNAQNNSPPISNTAPARDRPLEPNALTLAALRESVQRASSPQTAQQAASTKENRKSMTSQFVTPVSAYNANAQPMETTLQRNKSLTEQHKNSPLLTSAAIRGPEDFDLFVQSDEVHKYSLTPEPIRDAPTADADALAQLTGEVPLVAQPTAQSTAGAIPDGAMTEAEKKRHRYSVTKPPSRNSSVLRRSGMMAREARVITESTRDFADFIRSTKPDKEPVVRPLSTSMSASQLQQSYRNSTNYSMPRTASLTSERTKSLTRSDIAAGFAPPVPAMPAGGQSKSTSTMRPKSATGASKENGELIAFIRDGPREDGNPRISRTVAPFRNTMDSDQFDALNGGAKAPARTASTANRMSIMNGSSNAGDVAHPAYSQGPQMFNPLSSNPMNNDPPRKRPKNRDPYAIDLDDEDVEEDISALPKNRRSMIAPAETNGDGDKPIASAASLAQAKEIRDRARDRGSRSNSIYADGNDVTALPVPAVPKTPEARAATTGSRANGVNRSSANELAEFLRTSEPPSSAAPAPTIAKKAATPAAPAKKEKKRGFFASLFGRKKSTTASTTRHSDMP